MRDGKLSKRIFLIALAAVMLPSCASNTQSDFERPADVPPAGASLMRYDANHDSILTRAELEAGLKADFDRIDTNHNNCLSPEEVRAENQRRWAQDASMSSPLIDWKQKGCIDFEEFAATARSLFEQLDTDGNGKLTPDEINPRKKMKPHSNKPSTAPDTR